MERGKVVVIDDSPLVRRLAELALEEEGYKVYTAEDGEDGLKTAEEVMPSVILVDFIMPRMSGYQFCKLARESQILKDVPIILITGKGEDVGRKFIEKFGISDFFIKPFKSETLVEKVASIVETRQTGMQEEVAAAVAVEPYTAEAGEAEAVAVADLGEAAAGEEPYRIEIEELKEAAAVAVEPYTAEAGEAEAIEVVDLGEAAAGEEPYRIEIEELKEAAAVAVEPYTAEAGEAEAVAVVDLGEAAAGEEPYRIEIEELKEAAAVGVEPYAPEAGEAEAVTVADLREAGVSPSAMESALLTGVQPPSGFEPVVEHVIGRYLMSELPFLLQRSVSDVLKMYGAVRPANAALSGELSQVDVCQVFRFIEDARMTGRLIVHAPAHCAEVYFEAGRIAGASVSRPFVADPPREEVSHKPAESATYDALSATLQLTYGSFLFECLPPGSLPPTRHPLINTGACIAGIMRGADEKIPVALFRDMGKVFEMSASEGELAALCLNDSETRAASLVDGKRTLKEVAAESGMEERTAKKIFYVLRRTGAVREK